MTTIFRYAIQTRKKRHSEVWSFFANKNHGCLYATRTSMKHWLKVSFHESGVSHIKSNDNDDDSGRWGKELEWKYPEIVQGKPAHVMRVAFPVGGQRGNFEPDGRVTFFPEEWKGTGTVYLDVFFASSEKFNRPSRGASIWASHRLGERRWVHFLITASPAVAQLPEKISGMTFHMGDGGEDANRDSDSLSNTTAVWYCAPEHVGTFLAFEAAAAKFDTATLSSTSPVPLA